MFTSTIRKFIVLGALLGSVGAFAAEKARETTAILVDKKTNTLHVAKYVDGSYQILKSYHATLGQVKGEKVSEGDLKTPEGIYTFNNKSLPPRLGKKFGIMGFHLNFPNDFDKMAGITGSAIMLHATDTPDRLKKDYDSEGCVVVRNDEISEIAPSIRLGLTPILIFPELNLKDVEYMKPGQAGGPLKNFFQSWIKAWESKDLDSYIQHYHTDFSAQGKNKNHWKSYKGSLNRRYATIEIGPEDVMFYRHPKYSMITFTQNYRSKLKGGGWGHRSRGTKILYIAEEAGQPKIISETYTTLMW